MTVVSLDNTKLLVSKKGSATSGNRGHAGRPGRRGGSAPKKQVSLSNHVRVYHGTKREFVDSISKEGLKTSIERNASEWNRPDDTLFFSTDKNEALYFVDMAFGPLRQDIAIVSFDVDLSKAKPDEKDSEALGAKNSYYVEDSIPANAIKEIEIYSVNSTWWPGSGMLHGVSGSGRNGVYGYKLEDTVGLKEANSIGYVVYVISDNKSVGEKGSATSGNYGHSSRPGKEGGSMPKGGRRVPLPGGSVSKVAPAGKKIPPVPKLSLNIRGGSIPDHKKGDSTGQQAFNTWKGKQGNVSDADSSQMHNWFGRRANIMEHNLNIPTAVPGQRDELSDEAEDAEEKKKVEVKKKPGKGKGGKKKKGGGAKKKKGGGGGKKKKPKKKKGPTEEEQAKVAKAVGLSVENLNMLKSAEATLKAGGTLTKSTAQKLFAAGLLDNDGSMPSYARSLLNAILKGDAIKARAVLKRESVKRARAAARAGKKKGGTDKGKSTTASRRRESDEGDDSFVWVEPNQESKEFPVIRYGVKGSATSGNRGHRGRPGRRGGSSKRKRDISKMRPDLRPGASKRKVPKSAPKRTVAIKPAARPETKSPPTGSKLDQNFVNVSPFEDLDTAKHRVDTALINAATHNLPQSHLDMVGTVRSRKVTQDDFAGECTSDGNITLFNRQSGFSDGRPGQRMWHKDTVIHEVAHAVHFRMDRKGSRIGTRAKALYSRKASAAGKSPTELTRSYNKNPFGRAEKGFATRYSMESWQEMFADGYLMYVKNPAKLLRSSPDVYSLMRNSVFDGVEY